MGCSNTNEKDEEKKDYKVNSELKLELPEIQKEMFALISKNPLFVLSANQVKLSGEYAKQIKEMQDLFDYFTTLKLPFYFSTLLNDMFIKGAQYFSDKQCISDQDMAVVIMETALLFYTDNKDEEIITEKGEIIKIIIENAKMVDGKTVEQPEDTSKICLIVERFVDNINQFISFLLLNLYSVLSMLFLSQENIVKILDKNLEVNKVSKSNFNKYIINKLKKINKKYDEQSIVNKCSNFVFKPIEESKFSLFI